MKVASLLAAALAGGGGVNGFTTPSSRMQVPSSRCGTSPTLHAAADDTTFALLFDCDGVIIETEELHRLAYNAAFKHTSLQTQTLIRALTVYCSLKLIVWLPHGCPLVS